MITYDREELQRRLEQSRRLANSANDRLTQQRLQTLITDLEENLAAADAKDADASSSTQS